MHRYLLAALLLTCLTLVPVLAEETATVTEDDIRQLRTAGVAADVIITKLAASRCDFQLTSHDVLALTNEGMPQAVITAMITCAGKAPRPEADPCAMDLAPSPVAFPDLEWDQDGLRFDLVTLFVSKQGLCLKRVEDQVRRPIPWTNVAAICEERGFYRHVYLKLKTRDPNLAPFVNDTVLIFNGSPTALRPLFTHIRTVQPDLAVDCTLMEE